MFMFHSHFPVFYRLGTKPHFRANILLAEPPFRGPLKSSLAREVLQVVCSEGGGPDSVSGNYELVRGRQPAGYPLWKHTAKQLWMLTKLKAQWFIGKANDLDDYPWPRVRGACRENVAM